MVADEAVVFGNLTNQQCEIYDGFDFVMMLLLCVWVACVCGFVSLVKGVATSAYNGDKLSV